MGLKAWVVSRLIEMSNYFREAAVVKSQKTVNSHWGELRSHGIHKTIDGADAEGFQDYFGNFLMGIDEFLNTDAAGGANLGYRMLTITQN